MRESCAEGDEKKGKRGRVVKGIGGHTTLMRSLGW